MPLLAIHRAVAIQMPHCSQMPWAWRPPNVVGTSFPVKCCAVACLQLSPCNLVAALLPACHRVITTQLPRPLQPADAPLSVSCYGALASQPQHPWQPNITSLPVNQRAVSNKPLMCHCNLVVVLLPVDHRTFAGQLSACSF